MVKTEDGSSESDASDSLKSLQHDLDIKMENVADVPSEPPGVWDSTAASSTAPAEPPSATTTGGPTQPAPLPDNPVTVMIRFDKVCDSMAFDPDELSAYIKKRR